MADREPDRPIVETPTEAMMRKARLKQPANEGKNKKHEGRMSLMIA